MRCQIRNYLLCFEFNCFSSHFSAHTRSNFTIFHFRWNNKLSVRSLLLASRRRRTRRDEKDIFQSLLRSRLIHLYIFNWKSFINSPDQICFRKGFCGNLNSWKDFPSAEEKIPGSLPAPTINLWNLNRLKCVHFIMCQQLIPLPPASNLVPFSKMLSDNFRKFHGFPFSLERHS